MTPAATGPVQVAGEVLSVKRVGAHHHLTLVAARVAERFRPGSFVALTVGGAGAGKELAQFFDIADLGAVVTRSVTLDPRAGRPTPRMVETASGMLSGIGLQGPGLQGFLATELPSLAQHRARAVVSIAGTTLGEYGELARRIGNSPGVAAVEVNLSCPNSENRDREFAADPYQAAKVLNVVGRAHRPEGEEL